MSDSARPAHTSRPYVAALPLVLAVLLLTFFGKIDGWAAILLWLCSILSLGWIYGRYTKDIALEQRQNRILAEKPAPFEAHSPLSPTSVVANIVEGMSDPLILLDMKRHVVHANRVARELLGEHILGKDIAFYLRHPTALKAIDQSLTDHAPREQEITLLDPVERTCLMRIRVINASHDSGPEPKAGTEPLRYLILSILDITRIKQAEKMRVDFVANASHELRTPLSSIIGFIETLLGPAANDTGARNRFLGIMMNEASRMQRLIDDLLSLSRIEMDQHLSPEGRVDLPPLLQSLANTLDLRGGTGSPKCILDLPAGLPPIRGDRDQLVQVFQNLIDNAIKYGRPDEPMTISARPVASLPSRGGPGIVVTVFNSGDGISPEHLPRLTERFYRVDNARSRKMGGTGLGLAIVKHIITRHRGTMQIDSTMGVGTNVSIYLPEYKEVSKSEIPTTA